MSFKWYVVHVYSGSEKRVKETIEEQAITKNMTEYIEEVMVPTEEIFEIRKGTKVKREKKFWNLHKKMKKLVKQKIIIYQILDLVLIVLKQKLIC